MIGCVFHYQTKTLVGRSFPSVLLHLVASSRQLCDRRPLPSPPACLSAGTQAGEEIPIVSRSNIKEFKDSFSNENFDFRNSPNITFFVYVSNFSWPVKIQVSPAVRPVELRKATRSCARDECIYRELERI